MGSPARQARPSALARSVCEDVSENSSLPRGFQKVLAAPAARCLAAAPLPGARSDCRRSEQVNSQPRGALPTETEGRENLSGQKHYAICSQSRHTEKLFPLCGIQAAVQESHLGTPSTLRWSTDKAMAPNATPSPARAGPCKVSLPCRGTPMMTAATHSACNKATGPPEMCVCVFPGCLFHGCVPVSLSATVCAPALSPRRFLRRDRIAGEASG